MEHSERIAERGLRPVELELQLLGQYRHGRSEPGEVEPELLVDVLRDAIKPGGSSRDNRAGDEWDPVTGSISSVWARRRNGNAAQAFDPASGQRLIQPLQNRRAHQVQLLGPHRRRAGDSQDAGSLSRRLSFGRDAGTHSPWPDTLHLGQQRLRSQVVTNTIQREGELSRAPAVVGHASAPSNTAPSETTSRVMPGSMAPGTCSTSVVVRID